MLLLPEVAGLSADEPIPPLELRAAIDRSANYLQRQVLHGRSKVDMPKVESAAQRIADLNPDVKVIPYAERLDSSLHQRCVKGSGDAERNHLHGTRLGGHWNQAIDRLADLGGRHTLKVLEDLFLDEDEDVRAATARTVDRQRRRPTAGIPTPPAALE